MSEPIACTCGHCGHEFDAVPVSHRLLCGDARNDRDVDVLMDGATINVAVTSPPYASQRKYDESSGFKPIHPDAYVDWFKAISDSIARVIAKDGSFFLNIKEHCDDGQRHLYVKDLTIAHVRQWGWMFVDELCWRNTANGVPGGWPNRFKNAWEPIFHFSRNPTIKFFPDSVSAPSDHVMIYSAENSKSPSGSGFTGTHAERVPGMARPSNVLEAKAETSQSAHSAPFPVALPEFIINAFSRHGDCVYDPFMGSGTTLMAAERTGRVAYGMEISPAYCDVIVERYERSTGKTAVRVEASVHGN